MPLQRLTTLLPRFGASSLHQRDSRSQLFAGYNGSNSRSSPAPSSGGYGYSTPSPSHLNPGESRGGYRPATPNRKGQYSDAVLNELESQNDDQVKGILGKVRTLKDVRLPSARACLDASPRYRSPRRESEPARWRRRRRKGVEPSGTIRKARRSETAT